MYVNYVSISKFVLQLQSLPEVTMISNKVSFVIVRSICVQGEVIEAIYIRYQIILDTE